MVVRKIKVGFDISPYLHQEDFRAFIQSLIDNANPVVTSDPYYEMDLYIVSNTEWTRPDQTSTIASKLRIKKWYTVSNSQDLLTKIDTLNLEFFFTDYGDENNPSVDIKYLLDNQSLIPNCTPILVTRLFNMYTLTMKYVDQFYNKIQPENPGV